jgi:hypothetical protein
MITKIKEPDLKVFQVLSHPISCAEILFHDFDALGMWDKNKFGKIRLYQYPMMSFDSLFLKDKKLSDEKNWEIKNALAESYNLGGRLTGKTRISIIIDSVISTFNKVYNWLVISSYDKLHVQEIFEALINGFENHKILKIFNVRPLRSPNYKMNFANGCLLESVNMNVASKNPGGQFFGKHFDRHYMEESSFLTKEVSGKMLMAMSEKGCINRYSGMCTFTKTSPMGEIFFDLKNKKKIVNLPSYANPTWNDKKEADAIKEFGGKDCLDENTEILTDDGWKNIENISKKNKVVSWDIDNNISKYCNINKIIKYDNCQKMYLYKNQKVNFCLSKNHVLPIKTEKKGYRLEKLSNIITNKVIKKSYTLKDTSNCLQCNKKLDKSYKTKQKYFCSVGCKNKYTSQYEYYPIEHFYINQHMNWIGIEKENINIGGTTYFMDDFLAFLGWFISEGCVCAIKEKRGLFTWIHWRISISQSKNKQYIQEIGNILNRMKLREYYNNGAYTVTNKSLGTWLLENCGKYAQNKKIPKFVRHLTIRQINIFLDAFNKGDGDGKRTQYYTSSSILAKELQELIFKIGHVSSYTFRKNDISGLYTILESISDYKNIKINRNQITEIQYNGKIWCIQTNPYKTIFIKRNKKCMWSGNSPGYQVQIEGKIIEGAESVFDIQRIRETYIKDRKGDAITIKSFEVNKESFFRYKEIVVVEKPNNAEFLGIYADIGEGGAPSEYIIISQTNKIYKYIYRITTFQLSPEEEKEFIKYLIELLCPNIIGLDNTSGVGKALISALIKDYPENVIPVSFNENIDIDYEKDKNGKYLTDKEGHYIFKQANVVDWSMQCLKDIFYSKKIQCYEDIKFDTQINNVIVGTTKQGKKLYGYKTANHLFQAFQVFAIVHWQTEFKNIKPIIRRKPGHGAGGTV